MSFGARKCLVCGEDFEAQYAAQLCCSSKCKIERINTQKVAHRVSMRALRDEVKDLKERVDALEAHLSGRGGVIIVDDEDAKFAPTNVTVATSVPEEKNCDDIIDDTPEDKNPDYLPGDEDDGYPAKKKKSVEPTEYCERMKLKATKLPCGDQYKCWHPRKCERVPISKKRID